MPGPPSKSWQRRYTIGGCIIGPDAPTHEGKRCELGYVAEPRPAFERAHGWLDARLRDPES
jgi:hypothetical protein